MSVEKKVSEIRFKGFSGEWVQHNLGELIDIRSAARVHKEQWTEAGVPFFRTSDVVSIFKGQENTKAYISHEVYEALSEKIGKVAKDDLLITGGGSIGIPYLVPNNDPLYFKDADLLWLKNNKKFDGYFLYTFLFSEPFKKHIKSISHIGTIAHYTIEQAKATPVNTCDEQEQTQIGNYFQKLDNLINQHQQKHDKLSSIKKAMLEKMFPKQGETIPEIRFKGFGGEWEEKELGELAEIVRGASPRPIEDPKWFDRNSSVGWLRIRDVTEQDGRIYYLEQRISKLGQEKTRVLHEKHLLLSIAASVGKPVINYVDTGVHDGFLIFKKPLFELEFMYQWLKSFEEKWQQYGQPGSQVNLNSDIVKSQLVTIPSKEEQSTIGNYFQKLDTLIRDKNVLGFDPYKVCTFRDKDLREAVALEQTKADSVADAMANPAKKKKFNFFMNEVAMAGHKDATGQYIKGIEDYVPKEQYLTDEHQAKVVEDILQNWDVLSQANKFHAILATNSIAEAIDYYRRLKAAKPELKISALFDPNIDNDGGTSGRSASFKGDGLQEIMADYNARYGQDFDFARHAAFKKDLAARLAHKKPYERIHTEPAKQLDLLIVVDQMLTGFDSKWLNTLYLDKVIKYQNIIQAFSRTNRLFGPDKPHGTIRYYRYPHTMEQHINAAVKLYSGDRPIGLFVDRLESNLEAMNCLAADITELFANAGVQNFEKLPDDTEACAKFASLFKAFNQHLEAAKVQGFHWGQQVYPFGENDGKHNVTLAISEQTYLGLALRYKELAGKSSGGGTGGDVPFDISGYLTEIDTGKIDADYMNSRFEKYLKELNQHQDQTSIEQTLNELHKSFASLTQAEQKYAKLFLHDLQRGDAQLIEDYSFRDYINRYKDNAENAQLNAVVSALGLDKHLLMALLTDNVNEKNLNNFGRFDALKASVDKAKAKAYFEKLDGASLAPFKLNMRIDQFLKQFIFAQADERAVDLPEVFADAAALMPTPLVFGSTKLYRAEQVAALDNTLELGSITFKTDMPYEDNPASLLTTGCYAELKALGIVSSSVLDATLVVLLELEQVTKELELSLHEEGKSGIVWALKEARPGSLYNEFMAYAVQVIGDESLRTYIESGIYDLAKMSIGAAFISLPKVLIEKLKAKRKVAQAQDAQNKAIEAAVNVVDYHLAAAKKIPAFKVGNAWRFKKHDIEAWIAQQTKETGGEK